MRKRRWVERPGAAPEHALVGVREDETGLRAGNADVEEPAFLLDGIAVQVLEVREKTLA